MLFLLLLASLAGNWKFTVDLSDGSRGTPSFTLQQNGGKLTGSYHGPLGERTVTGTVDGERVAFSFEFERGGSTGKAVYEGKIEGPTHMSGTVKFVSGSETRMTGNWAATKAEPSTPQK